MIFKNPNKRSEVIIVTESGNEYYIPLILTVRETGKILYALYNEKIDWISTAIRNFHTNELADALKQRANQNPEKLLSVIFNINNLRAYASEIYKAVFLYYDNKKNK